MRGWLVMALISVSCGRSEPGGPAWTVADYTMAGVPDPGHAWTTSEVEQASRVLVEEARDRPERLPRYGSPESGAILARLTEAAPPDPPGASLQQRLESHMRRSQAVNLVSKLYVPQSVGTLYLPTSNVGGREFVELLAAGMVEQQHLFELIDPYLASLGPEGQSPARQHGLQQMREGVGAMMLGFVLMADQSQASTDLRRAEIQHLTAVLPTLFPRALPPQQHAIRERLTKLADATTGPLHDDLVAAERALPNP